MEASLIGHRIVLFGDETSLGLAAAMSDGGYAGDMTCLFEANAVEAVRQVIVATRLSNIDLFKRVDGDQHLAQIETRFADLASSGAIFVLTGKASSIQRLRQALKTLGVDRSRIMTKAYWAPGKAGLD